MTRIAICIAVVLGFAWACFEFGREYESGQEAQRKTEADKARAELVNATAEKLAAMAPTQAAITERVIREVKTNTVYRDCVLPDSGVRLLNNAIAGTKPEPTGGVGVQTASPQP